MEELILGMVFVGASVVLLRKKTEEKVAQIKTFWSLHCHETAPGGLMFNWKSISIQRSRDRIWCSFRIGKVIWWRHPTTGKHIVFGMLTDEALALCGR